MKQAAEVVTPQTFPTAQELRRWAFALIGDKPPGTIIGYDEIVKALTLDPRQTKKARDAVLRAGRQLLRERDRLLVNVRDVGYRIAFPNEHVAEGKRKQKAALRDTIRAQEALTRVDLPALNPDERRVLVIEQTRNGLKLGFTRRLDRAKELPGRPEVTLQLPTGRLLIEMFTKPRVAAVESPKQ